MTHAYCVSSHHIFSNVNLKNTSSPPKTKKKTLFLRKHCHFIFFLVVYITNMCKAYDFLVTFNLGVKYVFKCKCASNICLNVFLWLFSCSLQIKYLPLLVLLHVCTFYVLERRSMKWTRWTGVSRPGPWHNECRSAWSALIMAIWIKISENVSSTCFYSEQHILPSTQRLFVSGKCFLCQEDNYCRTHIF